MGQTFQQLGQLLLHSIPTIIIFVALHFYLKRVLYRPLRKVLAARSERIEGKLAHARQTLAAAESKLAEYESALRERRLAGYRAIEAQRQTALASGQAQLHDARQQTAAALVTARQELATESAHAKLRLQESANTLASQIMNQVLGKAATA
ncbi:MAG TPA: ATP synthase F0 subunit B [Terriglobales bacterium]|nr:ATP synthase F0 subunit B [Terriglobales bacterium]